MCNEPLESSRIKVDRAKSHIGDLNKQISTYIRRKPFRVVVEQDPDSPNHVWTLRVNKDVPKDFSAYIGDVVHNLRAALDLMATELVERAGGDPADVYFPFAGDADGLEEMIKKRHIDRAGEDVVKIVRSLKPYKGGNALLRAIHDLDIADKHQSLIPVAHYTGVPYLRLRNDQGGGLTMINTRFGPVRDGMKLIRMPPAGNVKLGQQFTPTFHITFDEGQPLGGEPVLQALHKLAETADSILGRFREFLTNRQA